MVISIVVSRNGDGATGNGLAATSLRTRLLPASITHRLVPSEAISPGALNQASVETPSA